MNDKSNVEYYQTILKQIADDPDLTTYLLARYGVPHSRLTASDVNAAKARLERNQTVLNRTLVQQMVTLRTCLANWSLHEDDPFEVDDLGDSPLDDFLHLMDYVKLSVDNKLQYDQTLRLLGFFNDR